LPKNEDGEFELVLGNKQLLSMFFVVVVLLGVFFVMGYIVGRNSAPLIAEIPHKSDVKPPVVDSPAPKPAPETEAPPAKTAPPPAEKSAEKAPEPAQTPPSQAPPKEVAPAKTAPVQTTKAEPPKPEPAPKKEPKATEKTEPAKPAKAAPPASVQAPGGQPLPGAIYLQISATVKADADKYVETLRKAGFAALNTEVPEKPGLFRVFVGPVPAADVNKTKTDLQAKGFPGDKALPKRF
jgi:cell division septation protein DedD